MSGGKETPRQKMIGMMYLVLTALLAMNVSKEVVDAFVTIDHNQMNNLAAIDGKLGTQMNALQKNASENPKKYGPAKTSAERVHKEASALIEHINKIKAKTFSISIGNGVEADIPPEVYSNGEFLIDLDSVKALVGIDNYDNNTNLMVQDASKPTTEPNADGYNYTAVELRNKLEAYRDAVISELKKIKGTEILVKNVEKNFDFPKTKEEDPNSTIKAGEEQWVVKNFYHVPLAASTAMLSGLQNRIRTAESDLVDKLYTDVEGDSFKFNRLKSAVIPQATTISAGSNYEADVFLSAYDDQNAPVIWLGDPGVKWDSINQKLSGEYKVVEMVGTMGKVKLPASGLGVQQREGVINFKPVGGDPVVQPFKLDYSVVAPQLVVSPTAMNVFYKGIPNPVEVSVPGFTADAVSPSISNGSISKGANGYVVNVSSGKEANVSASVELPDGTRRSMGPAKFRVKKIPDPVPSFGQKGPSDNIISKAVAKAASGVRAKMDGFEMDVPGIVVTKFTVFTTINGEFKEIKCTGNRLSPAASALIAKLRKGQKFGIEEIFVKMPDGERKVPSLSLRIL